MKKLLLTAGLLVCQFALPSQAMAFGMGTSVGFGAGQGGGGPFGGFGDFGGVRNFGASSFAPTLDLVVDPSAVIQLHVLETIGTAIDGGLFIGANAYFGVGEALVGGKWSAVVQPGGSLDLIGDPTTVVFAGECRFGIQAKDAAGFGLYLVPAIGLAASNGDAELFTGGALQMSVWFNL